MEILNEYDLPQIVHFEKIIRMVLLDKTNLKIVEDLPRFDSLSIYSQWTLCRTLAIIRIFENLEKYGKFLPVPGITM